MGRVPIPPNWGKDKLSKFISDAIDNSYCTFVNLSGAYNRLRDIDKIFHKANESLTNSKDWFIGLFMMRSHSAFLAATRLAISTQLVESYMVQRGCIENALYGYYLFYLEETDPTTDYYEIWFNRHDDDEWSKLFNDTFKYGKARDALKKRDAKHASIAHTLYRRSIDYGAHPNPYGILSNVEIIKKGKKKEMRTLYLNSTEDPFHFCLKSVAQVGCCSLSIFEHVFKKRFEIAGISDQITKAKEGL